MNGFAEDLLTKTKTEFEILKQEVWKYFESTFLPVEKISQYEQEMLPYFKKEKWRIMKDRLKGQDPLLEVKKVVQFFYLREKGEKIRYREMNPYVREFLNKHNAKIFKDSPLKNQPLNKGLAELVRKRLILPEACPEDVFQRWLPEQFERALENIPGPILQEGGFGKACRVLAGVFMYSLTSLDGVNSKKIVNDRLEKAVKGGYYFGLFYPLIDDILDHPEVLSKEEKKEFSRLIDRWIIGDFSLQNTMSHFSSILLLEDIFKEFHQLFPIEEYSIVYSSALKLYFAQLDDSARNFETFYQPSELYPPVMLKAAYTRILAAAIGGITVDSRLTDHMHRVGLNLQLLDDFRDWFEDLKIRQFTPFTYYILGPQEQIVNPFSLYLASSRVHFRQFNDDRFLVKLLMRRKTNSIQQLSKNGFPVDLKEQVWSAIYSNENIGKIARKIHISKHKVFDPDIEFTKPVDNIVNGGRDL